MSLPEITNFLSTVCREHAHKKAGNPLGKGSPSLDLLVQVPRNSWFLYASESVPALRSWYREDLSKPRLPLCTHRPRKEKMLVASVFRSGRGEGEKECEQSHPPLINNLWEALLTRWEKKGWKSGEIAALIPTNISLLPCTLLHHLYIKAVRYSTRVSRYTSQACIVYRLGKKFGISHSLNLYYIVVHTQVRKIDSKNYYCRRGTLRASRILTSSGTRL